MFVREPPGRGGEGAGGWKGKGFKKHAAHLHQKFSDLPPRVVSRVVN